MNKGEFSRWHAIVAGLLALAVLVVGIVLLKPEGPEPITASCRNTVSLYFDSDVGMSRAAQRLREDDRIHDLRIESQDEAEKVLRSEYSSFPTPTATPESGPAAASVYLVAADEIDRNRLAKDLTREFTAQFAAESTGDPAPTVDGKPVSCTQTAAAPVIRRCGDHVIVTFSSHRAMRQAQHRIMRGELNVGRTSSESAADDDRPAAMRLSPPPGTDIEAFANEMEDKLTAVKSSVPQVCVALPHPALR